jgi:hypothetical protein
MVNERGMDHKSDYGSVHLIYDTLWRRHGIIFAAAFLIPFVMLALVLWAASFLSGTDGHSSAVSAPTASPTLPVTGVWPQDVPFIAHTIPAMIRDDIAYTGARRGYRFEGRAGDEWHITVEPEESFDPEIRLYGPSGSELAYNDDQYAASLAAEIRIVLPADGTYRLLVEAAAKSSGATGTYWLLVFEE